MALRLVRVCVCGHDEAEHRNRLRLESRSCQFVAWANQDPMDGAATAVCVCSWWRPLLIPRLRNVSLKPMGLPY